jgi:NAD-dependent dihydropyrimidine dehydrogenase PreA subunit
MNDDWNKKELQQKAEDMTAVTIPVNISIEGKQRILDLTAAEKILKSAHIISLGNCGCRTRMKKCTAPLDVCLCLDKQAETLIKNKDAKAISVGEAMNVLKRSHEADLVHLAFTNKGDAKPWVICSCCSCCCHALSSIVRFNIPQAVTESDHIAFQNMKKCKDCGICADRCQFHARQIIDGKLEFDRAKCFGCGLCVSTCPNEAISLVERRL